MEGVLALMGGILPAVFLFLETARVTYQRASFQLAAFHYVRHRALGLSSIAAVRAVTRRWGEFLLFPDSSRARRSAAWEAEVSADGRKVDGRFSVRSGTWFPAWSERRQVTERCRFFW